MPKPSAPITAPECRMLRGPTTQRGVDRHVGVQGDVVADRHAAPDEATGTDARPRADDGHGADDRMGPIAALGATFAPGSMTADACTPATTAGVGCRMAATFA